MRKRITSLLIVAALSVGMTACMNTADDPNEVAIITEKPESEFPTELPTKAPDENYVDLPMNDPMVELPTETPVEESTDIPDPTITPEIDPVESTETPEPTIEPTATVTPKPTNTPMPTVTNTPIPTATSTPIPTATPMPELTNTPVPTKVPESTSISEDLQTTETGEIVINTDQFKYNTKEQVFTTYSAIGYLKGTLSNPESYDQLSLTIFDDRGNVVVEKTTEPVAEWRFESVGLFIGKNKVVVTATGKTIATSTIYIKDSWGINYFVLEGAGNDTDNDGIYDLLERYAGTDPNKPDTDGDGLTDYQELNETGTDPLLVDTDNNGISDFDEDDDEDGLSNGKEYELGTSPTFRDGDFDGISDYQEVYEYGTDPQKEDTDDDGVNDGWEVLHGYDPKSYDKSFFVTDETAPVSESKPVSAKITVKASGIDDYTMDSLEISKSYSLWASPMVVGRLGDAYYIDAFNTFEFESAELTMMYDISLGELSDTFQPKIYYFNENTKMYEELENQTITEGEITVQITVIPGIYMLRNSVEVDAIWD